MDPEILTATEAQRCVIPLSLSRLQSDNPQGRREYGVKFISAGWVRRRDNKQSNWRILPEALRNNVSLFNARGVQVDHANLADLFYPSLFKTSGVSFGARWDEAEQAIAGGVRLYRRDDLRWLSQFLDEILEDQEAGREVPDVGLSAVLWPVDRVIKENADTDEETRIRETFDMTHVETTDFVFGPGAEGRLRQVLQSLNLLTPNRQVFTLGGEPVNFCTQCGNALTEAERNGTETHVCPEPNESPEPAEVSALAATEPAQSSPPASQPQPAQPGSPPPAGQPPQQNGNFLMTREEFEAMNGRIDRLTGAVERLVGGMAHAEDSDVVQGMGHAPNDRRPAWNSGIWSNGDQIIAAYEQLMGLPVSEPVHRLSGIRELYILLTGDRNMRGQFNAEHALPVRLAYSSSGNNADTSVMAEVTRNVMNKVLIQQASFLREYEWWRKIAKIENLNSLQQVSWIRYGGIGYDTGVGLPTVDEKGEYQQLLWEDARTTADWEKHGGYLPLSLEMIDRDDVMAWRDVPRQLALAQAVTISYAFSVLFTANSGAGPALGDGVGDGYAFNTTRGNLLTQPLNWTNWNAAVSAMYAFAQLKNATQTEDRRQGVRPDFVMIPVELEENAVEDLTSQVVPGASNAQPTSIRRRLSEDRIVTVPHWTNQDNWCAIANPMVVPFCGVAFRFGDMPEIFAPSESNHILWLHDVLPIKTRWFFAISVIDWRGAIKSNNS